MLHYTTITRQLSSYFWVETGLDLHYHSFVEAPHASQTIANPGLFFVHFMNTVNHCHREYGSQFCGINIPHTFSVEAFARASRPIFPFGFLMMRMTMNYFLDIWTQYGMMELTMQEALLTFFDN